MVVLNKTYKTLLNTYSTQELVANKHIKYVTEPTIILELWNKCTND